MRPAVVFLVFALAVAPFAAGHPDEGNFFIDFGVGGGGLESFWNARIDGKHVPAGPYAARLVLDGEQVWQFGIDANPLILSFIHLPLSVTEGFHTVGFEVDYLHQVAEVDETDNVLTETHYFSDARPDLALEILSAEVAGVLPSVFTIETRTCNVGLASTTAPIDLDVWIARRDDDLRALFPPILASLPQEGLLAPSDCMERTLEVEGHDIAVGTYDISLSAITDVAPYISELSWPNNSDAVTIVAPPPSI